MAPRKTSDTGSKADAPGAKGNAKVEAEKWVVAELAKREINVAKRETDASKTDTELEGRETAVTKRETAVQNVEKKSERRQEKLDAAEGELALKSAEATQVRERQDDREKDLVARENALASERQAAEAGRPVVPMPDVFQGEGEYGVGDAGYEGIKCWVLDNLRYGGKTHKPGGPPIHVTQKVFDRLSTLGVVTDKEPAN